MLQAVLKHHQGHWTVAVMSENLKAVRFWQKIIGSKCIENFHKAENEDEYDMRIFSFEAKDTR